MSYFVYDGTFEHLMSLQASLFSGRIIPEGFFSEGDEDSFLFSETIRLASDPVLSQKYTSRLEKMSPLIMRYLCAAYLSEVQDFEMIMYRFLRSVDDQGCGVIENYTDDGVRDILQLDRNVYGECHRMLGLLRFSELSDGTFYAPFEPDHNIASIVAPHFSRRLADQNWIIHDAGRNIGIFYKKSSRRWEMFNMEQSSALTYSENELEYRRLWKLYCKEIAIPERKNPRCQKQFMPVRYWKYLTEKQ